MKHIVTDHVHRVDISSELNQKFELLKVGFLVFQSEEKWVKTSISRVLLDQNDVFFLSMIDDRGEYAVLAIHHGVLVELLKVEPRKNGFPVEDRSHESGESVFQDLLDQRRQFGLTVVERVGT